MLLGSSPGNNPSDVVTVAINAKTKVQTTITGITGSDEVWFNRGDGRFYTGSSRDCAVAVFKHHIRDGNDDHEADADHDPPLGFDPGPLASPYR